MFSGISAVCMWAVIWSPRLLPLNTKAHKVLPKVCANAFARPQLQDIANKVITAQGHSWIPNKLHFHKDFVLAAWQKAVGSHHHGQPKVLLPRQDGH